MGETLMTGLALQNMHRGIPVSAQTAIDNFAKNKKCYLEFVI
jgi:hypothetical protein